MHRYRFVLTVLAAAAATSVLVSSASSQDAFAQRLGSRIARNPFLRESGTTDPNARGFVEIRRLIRGRGLRVVGRNLTPNDRYQLTIEDATGQEFQVGEDQLAFGQRRDATDGGFVEFLVRERDLPSELGLLSDLDGNRIRIRGFQTEPFLVGRVPFVDPPLLKLFLRIPLRNVSPGADPDATGVIGFRYHARRGLQRLRVIVSRIDPAAEVRILVEHPDGGFREICDDFGDGGRPLPEEECIFVADGNGRVDFRFFGDRGDPSPFDRDTLDDGIPTNDDRDVDDLLDLLGARVRVEVNGVLLLEGRIPTFELEPL